jgi:hypothetical protein
MQPGDPGGGPHKVDHVPDLPFSCSRSRHSPSLNDRGSRIGVVALDSGGPSGSSANDPLFNQEAGYGMNCQRSFGQALTSAA